MKFNNIHIDVFIILQLKLLYVARIHGIYYRMEDDINELSVMLGKIKTDRQFFTRKMILDDDKEESILQFYNSEVAAFNVYKLFHVLNIALSCEYSEIAYHYITLSDMLIGRCLTKFHKHQHQTDFQLAHPLQNCLESYYSKYVKFFMEHTEIMVLSLAYLMKFTKNPVFKYHEVLKYLLLWYTFTYHNNQTWNKMKLCDSYENLMSLIEPIKLTNYQIKSSLERFIFKHCRYPKDFESFSRQVRDNVNKKTVKDEKVLIKTIGDKLLKSIAILNYHSVQTKHVINSSDEELRTLISLLNSQVPRGSIQITKEKSKIKDNEKLTDILEVFDNSIKDSLDLNEIFLYNHTLIQVVYEVIIQQEIKAVQKIRKDNSVSNTVGECFKLLKIVESYIKNFRDNALYEQSIILRRKLLENRESLADVCRLMKDTGKHEKIDEIVATWVSELKWVHEIKNDADFESFLDSLAKTRIAAKFHPVVLNAFCEKTEVIYVAEHIRVYGSDLKLYTMYNKTVDSVLCDKMLSTMKLVERIEIDMGNYLTTYFNNETVFSNFRNKLDEAIVEIANITLNAPTQYSLDWEKILLTLLYNKNNTLLFDKEKQLSFNGVQIQRLITFLFAVRNLLREKWFVLCSCGASSDPDAVGNCAGSIRGQWTDKVINISQIDDVAELNGLRLYKMQFQIITDRIAKLVWNSRSWIADMDIYWDGNKKAMTGVYIRYENQAFDIQDAQDYANFFVKWVSTIPYTWLMLLVREMVGGNLKVVTSEEVAEIKTSVDSFMKLDVLANSPVKYYFTHWVSTLETFIDGNSNDLQTNLTEIYDEIGILNFVVLPSFTKDYSVWIGQLLSDIDQLVTFLALSKNEKEIMGYS